MVKKISLELIALSVHQALQYFFSIDWAMESVGLPCIYPDSYNCQLKFLFFHLNLHHMSLWSFKVNCDEFSCHIYYNLFPILDAPICYLFLNIFQTKCLNDYQTFALSHFFFSGLKNQGKIWESLSGKEKFFTFARRLINLKSQEQ